MKDRILEFMKSEGLTNSRLAELVGVQSSNISHIINGRNKPGFDFIANILKRFPTLNPHWLILGVGDMYLNQMSATTNDKLELDFSKQTTIPKGSDNLHLKGVTSTPGSILNLFNEDIERIILLKKDGTFITYSPN